MDGPLIITYGIIDQIIIKIIDVFLFYFWIDVCIQHLHQDKLYIRSFRLHKISYTMYSTNGYAALLNVRYIITKGGASKHDRYFCRHINSHVEQNYCPTKQLIKNFKTFTIVSHYQKMSFNGCNQRQLRQGKGNKKNNSKNIFTFYIASPQEQR